jgi:hypothetical protein
MAYRCVLGEQQCLSQTKKPLRVERRLLCVGPGLGISLLGVVKEAAFFTVGYLEVAVVDF